MKSKTICKITIDFIMTVSLLISMAYMLTGQVVHEWIGTLMFGLFIVHNALNFKWYKNLLKGRYTAFRLCQTVLNLLGFIIMIVLMASGIIMSRHVFAFLSVKGGISFARQAHMLASYWGFIIMSLHLGLHWSMIIGMMRKAVKSASPSAARAAMFQIIIAVIAAYGIYAFIKHDIASYLFLETKFAFFDFERSPVLFFVDFMAIMGLFIFIAYHAAQVMHWISSRKRGQK
jgi:hypothetical protein